MKTYIKNVTITSLLFLLTGALLKFFMLPNQVLLVAAAVLLLLLFFLPALTRQNLKISKGFFPKLVDVLMPLLILGAMIALFMGVMRQGMIPLLIYFSWLGLIALYFIMQIRKAGENKAVLRSYGYLLMAAMVLLFFNSPFQQIVPDRLFDPAISEPVYAEGTGPAVYIDEAHNNFHTRNGLYRTFGNILKKDGYRLEGFDSDFSTETLKEVGILVISNAIHKKNVNHWSNPTYSAFTDEEIKAVQNWVNNGGSLFLIADHMPFPGAAMKLAAAFGFEFHNGHAIDTVHRDDVFYRANGTLHPNVITNGRDNSESVDSIRSFSGQAFQLPEEARPIITFGADFYLKEPESAWDISSTPAVAVEGWAQGAYMEYGKGRIVVFGEAAMFTGQLGAGLSWMKIGLNRAELKDNYQLLLNILHWLDGTIE